MFEKEIIVDGRGHLVGRLASMIAHQLLVGQKIVVVRCEALVYSGSLFRNNITFHEFLRKANNTNPRDSLSTSGLHRECSGESFAECFHTRPQEEKPLSRDSRCSRASHTHTMPRREWSCHRPSRFSESNHSETLA